MAMLDLKAVKAKASRKQVFEKSVKNTLAIASKKDANVATVTADLKARIDADTRLYGVLTQTGEYARKRFQGANDHSPEEQIRVLADAMANGFVPELID